MAAEDAPDRETRNRHQIFDWMIPLAGVILVLFATAMFGIFPRNPNNVIIAIALFGVGCAALWFGLVHADIHTTEKKIEQIRKKAEQVHDLVGKTRK